MSKGRSSVQYLPLSRDSALGISKLTSFSSPNERGKKNLNAAIEFICRRKAKSLIAVKRFHSSTKRMPGESMYESDPQGKRRSKPEREEKRQRDGV